MGEPQRGDRQFCRSERQSLEAKPSDREGVLQSTVPAHIPNTVVYYSLEG